MNAKAEPKSLIDFVREQRMTECPVCRLPEEVRLQMKNAARKRINRETIFAWLKVEHAFQGDEDSLIGHTNGHHDRKLKELNGDA